MAKVCLICGKSKSSGFSISHSNIKTKRKWRPNVHKIKVLLDGKVKRANVCTRCLKAGKVKRAI